VSITLQQVHYNDWVCCNRLQVHAIVVNVFCSNAARIPVTHEIKHLECIYNFSCVCLRVCLRRAVDGFCLLCVPLSYRIAPVRRRLGLASAAGRVFDTTRAFWLVLHTLCPSLSSAVISALVLTTHCLLFIYQHLLSACQQIPMWLYQRLNNMRGFFLPF